MCMLSAMVPWREPLAWEIKMGKNYLTMLMKLNASIGNKDGCGLAVPIHTLKWGEAAPKVILKKEATTWLHEYFGRPIIGHVRARSHGTASTNGAHPFLVKNVILAHNGTFSNSDEVAKQKKVKALLKGEKDPVDSHVLAAVIASKSGNTPITVQTVKDSLNEMQGSYALLMFETFEDNLWVIRGVNSLHLCRSGPFWVVNTSLANLDTINAYVQGTSHLMFDREWKVETPTMIPAQTINILNKKGLKQVGVAPTLATAQTWRDDWSGSNHWTEGATWNDTEGRWEFKNNITTKGISTANAMKLALLYHGLQRYGEETLKYLFLEVLNRNWFECTEKQLEAIEETLKSFWEMVTPDKKKVWDSICSKFTLPYCEFHDCEFPWPINDLDILQNVSELGVSQ